MKKGVTLVGIALVWLTGCGHTVQRYTRSAEDDLYPEKDGFVEKTGRPHLHVPITVGDAFVPDSQRLRRNRQSAVKAGGIAREAKVVLFETEKGALLEKVGQRFENVDFTNAIEIIPWANLVPQGRFANLDRIRTMDAIDVIALVRHDQTQFTDEGSASITYGTLVGACAVPGETMPPTPCPAGRLFRRRFDRQAVCCAVRRHGHGHLASRPSERAMSSVSDTCFPLATAGMTAAAMAAACIPLAGQMMAFDRTAIIRGECWRLISGRLYPYSSTYLRSNRLSLVLVGAWIETKSRKRFMRSAGVRWAGLVR